jgi:DNA-binding Lrp family transcriptional regulator
LRGQELGILDIMERDYRVPVTQIADSLGISRATVKRRLRSMYDSGVFQGYQVEVDRHSLGLERMVYIEVKTNPREDWLPRAIETMGCCVESHGVIGEFGLIFKMMFETGEALAGRLTALDSLISSTESKRYEILDVIDTYKERGSRHRTCAAHPDNIGVSVLRAIRSQESASPLTVSEIAGRVRADLGRGVSKSTVQRRLSRMEELGIIRQFTVKPRVWHRGAGVRCFIRVKTEPAETDETARGLASRDEFISLYRTGEDYCLFGDVLLPSMDSLDSFVKRLYARPGVRDTVTTIILETRKEIPFPVGSLAAGSG